MSKPYGPIRRWLDKIGLISASSEEQIPTAELPKHDFEAESQPEPESEYHPTPEPELLTEQELESSTADTRPLPPEMSPENFIQEPKMEAQMESKVTNKEDSLADKTVRSSGPLLDLGDFEPAQGGDDDDFVLDLDLDDVSEMSPVAGAFSGSTAGNFGRRSETWQTVNAGDRALDIAESERDSAPPMSPELVVPTVDPMAETQELVQPILHQAPKAESERAFAEPQILESETLRMPRPAAESSQISLEQLSPEAINAIARRAVELLSERVVQEIAWEVVPQLAELMIKRQLEEKNT